MMHKSLKCLNNDALVRRWSDKFALRLEILSENALIKENDTWSVNFWTLEYNLTFMSNSYGLVGPVS